MKGSASGPLAVTLASPERPFQLNPVTEEYDSRGARFLPLDTAALEDPVGSLEEGGTQGKRQKDRALCHWKTPMGQGKDCGLRRG